jgi:DNA polymerase IV (DinB-like DNA polymerase)
MGIETAGDLAAADPDRLADELGERGPDLHRRARGDDDRAVTPTGLPKSLSRESSLSATADEETKRETVRALAADVARRARERGCLYRTIGIKAVEPPYEVNTRARSLPGPVDDPDLVESVALDLLEEFAGDRVRKLGVRVSNLDFAESDQATLGGFDPGDGAREGRDDEGGRGAVGTGGDGGKLTDWIGGEPTGAESDEDDETAADRRTGDGQASLGDWS